MATRKAASPGVAPALPRAGGKVTVYPGPPDDVSGEYDPLALAEDAPAPATDPDAVPDSPTALAGEVLRQKLGGSLGLSLALGQAGAFPNAGTGRVAPAPHTSEGDFDPLAPVDERQAQPEEYDPLSDPATVTIKDVSEFDPLKADSGPVGLRGFLFPPGFASLNGGPTLPAPAPVDPQSELAPTQSVEPKPAPFKVTEAEPGTVQDVNPPGIPLTPGAELAANTLGKSPFQEIGDVFNAGAADLKKKLGDAYHSLFPAQSGAPQSPAQAQQNLQRNGAFVWKSGIEPVVQVFDLPNSAKNAFLNTYTQYVDQHSAPGIEGTYRTFAAAVAKGWGAAGQNLGANAKAVGPGATQDFQHVPLRDFWGRIAPFMKEMPVIPKDAQGAVAMGFAPAAGGTAGYGFLVATERAMRQMGFTQAADETAKALHSLSSAQVDALKSHYIPLDKVADFVTDIATDPLQVVDASGKWLRVGLLKSMPGLATAEGLARSAKIEGSLVSKLPPWFHEQVTGVLAARYTREEITKAEVQIANSVRDVTGTVKDIRDTGNRLSKQFGTKPAGKLDKWVFDYADAGSQSSPYKSRQEVLAAAADELEDPVTKKVPGEVLSEIKRLGEDVSRQEQEFGRQMTRTGFMHPETFQALRGNHIRYLYETGHYTDDGIMRALSQMARGSSKKLADTNIVKQRSLWDRFTQQLNGLQESAILGHGVGGTMQAKTTGYLNMLDRISEGPFAIKDPFADVNIAVPVKTAEDATKYFPASRMVRGQRVNDLANIGDTVRYSDASGRDLTGKIEDITLNPSGGAETMVLSDGTALNRADIEALQGKFEKLDGPYYQLDGEPLPEAIRSKKAYADKNPARDRAVNDMVTAVTLPDGTRLPVKGVDTYLFRAEEERKVLAANLDLLRERENSGGSFPGGTPLKEQLDQAEAELARHDAVIRRIRALKTNGSVEVRDPQLIQSDTVAGRTRQQDLVARINAVDDRIKTLDKVGSPKTAGVLSGLKRQRADLVNNLHGQEQQLQDLALELEESQRLNARQKVVRPLSGLANAEADTAKRLREEAAGEALRQIPADWTLVEGKEWGPLSGHYIPPAMKKLILARYSAPLGADNPWLKAAAKVVGIIKYNKTALNPATHFNNLAGNAVLAEIGASLHDTSLLEQPWVFKQAADEITAGSGRWLNELRSQSNVFDSVNDATREIQGIRQQVNPLPQTAFGKAADIAGNIYRAPGQAFQKEEQLFKLSLYIALRKKGLPALDAAKATQRYLFDYSDVPQMVEVFRRYGISPFMTFPYKATGVLLETMAKRPSLINRYNILQGQARSFFEDDNVQQQYDQLLKGKPYLAGQATIPVGKDGKGNILFLDLTKKLPLGFADNPLDFTPAGVISNSFMFGLPTGALANTGAPSPIPGEGPAFLGYNRDPDRPEYPLIPPGAAPNEQAKLQTEKLLQAYLPPFMLPSQIGGLSVSPGGRRIENALSGRAGGRSLYSPVQSAWVATAQSVFGVALHVQQGPGAPDSEGLVSARQDYIREKDQPYLRALSEAFNEAARDPQFEGKVTAQFPSVRRMTNVPELERLAHAAEYEIQRTALDFSRSDTERKARYRNQMRYLFAINRRAAELARPE